MIAGVSADDLHPPVITGNAVEVAASSKILAVILLLAAALLTGRAAWTWFTSSEALPLPAYLLGLAIVLALPVLLAALAAQSIRIDDHGIECRGFFRSRRLPWSKVRRISLRRNSSGWREVIIRGRWRSLAFSNGLATPWAQRQGFWPGTRLLVVLARLHDIPVEGPWTGMACFWDLDPDDQTPPSELSDQRIPLGQRTPVGQRDK